MKLLKPTVIFLLFTLTSIQSIRADPTPDPHDSTPAPSESPESTTTEATTKRSRLSEYYKMFMNPEDLQYRIRTTGVEEFRTKYHVLFKNEAIVSVVEAQPEVTRRQVKEILSRVVEKEEETIAYAVEASDWDLDLRRDRHDNNQQQGKTGVFVLIFRRILDWIYGKDYLEAALEAGKEKNRIMARLKQLGLSADKKDVVEQLVRDYQKEKAQFKGEPLDPFTISQWPSFDAPAAMVKMVANLS